jgi:hypothetical protein
MRACARTPAVEQADVRLRVIRASHGKGPWPHPPLPARWIISVAPPFHGILRGNGKGSFTVVTYVLNCDEKNILLLGCSDALEHCSCRGS